MIELSAVDLSRLQFGLTAMYHFIFVPLTLGLALIIAMMETVYVMTDIPIWKKMTKFWGALFGINFAMGVATGVPLEFQIGMNWAYYSHYVGDVFGSLLAIEGLMAFFLEATFVGLFFFGWERLSKRGHLTATWLMAIGTNLSALWILVANAWMQNPVGAKFNVDSMRMEMTSFYDVFFNIVAQSKFVHTVSAGYVTGSLFVLAMSSYYLLRRQHIEIAKRSFLVAASFGLASTLAVVVLGDESGYAVGQNQKMKLAAIESMWETEPAPASFTVLGLPNVKEMRTDYAIQVPWLLGIIATRSFQLPVLGIKDLVTENEAKIRDGMIAYYALQDLKKNRGNADARQLLEKHGDHLGYAFLLKKENPRMQDVSDAQIRSAARLTIPNVPVLFWAFRIMVGLGFFFILLFAGAYYCAYRGLFQNRLFLRVIFWSWPLPWVAAESGWLLAEHGRQPWSIDGILPTFLSHSVTSPGNVWISLIGFVVFYTALAIVEVCLMIKYIKAGPPPIDSQDLRSPYGLTI